MAAVRTRAAVPADTARLLDSLTTSVMLASASGELLYLNASAEDLLGISKQRATGLPLTEVFERDEGMLELIRRTGEDGHSFARREISLLTQHGPLVVDCRVTPLNEGRLDGPLLVEIHDASPRVRIRRDNTLRAQRHISRLMVRQLAHEIKNPLGGLRGAAQLLERALPSADLVEYTQVIIAEADRLKALVDDLLGPGGQPDRKPVNVHELLQHVFRLVAAEAPPGVTVLRDYDPSLPQLRLDRTQIIQAVLNLAKNALESVGAQGTIVFRTRARTNVTLAGVCHRLVISLELEDDGPGVPEDLQDTIFYPLVTGRAAGTGLGLPLAQELVNRHGGLIEFDTRPGRTVFRVGLPFQETGDEC
jgi:two-component system, NtrC family, nitrogen regulation sensor histidine kinase GlnL